MKDHFALLSEVVNLNNKGKHIRHSDDKPLVDKSPADLCHSTSTSIGR